jgi:ribosomal protein L12E/L44/L45/RPP1/RPP2
MTLLLECLTIVNGFNAMTKNKKIKTLIKILKEKEIKEPI